MRVRMVVEYDGGAFAGWQLQPDRPTVQGALEKALAIALGEPVRIEAAGRTDAGVHARGQVVAFSTSRERDLRTLARSLNALAGPDIAVRTLGPAAEGFDPRRHARRRAYEYRILSRAFDSPFSRRTAWHVHTPLDLEPMREAAGWLVGEHDFASFQAADCDAEHSVRRIFESALARNEDEIVYRIEATAFLRHMVRNIVGTLVEVGRGERSAESVRALLVARDRRLAGATAPAHGLCLVRVDYEE